MPLSEYEQRVLNQLEAQLNSEDPGLGSRMAATSAPRRGRVAAGLMGVLLGLGVLVLGMAVSQPWVSLLGFGVMFASAYFALAAPKALPPGAQPPKGKAKGKGKPPKPGLSDRFMKRFDEGGGF
jgi:hypothetical protein